MLSTLFSPSTGLNNTVPRQCSSPETRPQPTTDYTDSSETRPQPTTTDYNDIIATTVAGIVISSLYHDIAQVISTLMFCCQIFDLVKFMQTTCTSRYSMCRYLNIYIAHTTSYVIKYLYQPLILTIKMYTSYSIRYMLISNVLSHKGISLVEKTAVGVSVSLFIIITSAITLLLVVCGFMYWRRTSGKWKET